MTAILYNLSTPSTYPQTVADFRAAFPGLAVGDAPTDAELQPYGWRVVAPTDPPIPGPNQRVEQAPQPELVDGTYRQSWVLVDLPPPPPAADWVAFDLAIQNEPAIVSVINDLGRLSQVATLSLGHALEEAERGNIDRFLPIWQEWLIATTPSDAVLQRFRDLAAQHHLPTGFQAAIAAAPAGPQTPPA